jgi:YHS domain-containing protein
MNTRAPQRRLRLHFACFIALLPVGAAARAQATRDQEMKIDVVALIDRAEEVQGRSDVSRSHGKFTYWFASEENLARFVKSPQKYAIQFGGACARMGPLSGAGTPRLFAVYDDKLYIFASEQCRAAFLRSPAQFIDVDDAPIEAGDEARAHGREMLGKAVDAVACLALSDTLTTYREMLEWDRESGGRTYRVTETMRLMFPGRIRTDTCWDDSCWAFVADDAGAWSLGSDGVSPLEESQQRALWRHDGRHPLAILRARDAGDVVIAGRQEKRSVIVPGEGEIEVELVHVHRPGATTTLGLDQQGRVRLLSYRGRGPDATLGVVERVYGQFHDVSGFKLPGRVDVSFNGQAVAEESGVFAEQVVNDPADIAAFNDPPANSAPSSMTTTSEAH